MTRRAPGGARERAAAVELGSAAVLRRGPDGVEMDRLFGFRIPPDEPRAIESGGLAVLCADGRRAEGADLGPGAIEAADGRCRVSWKVGSLRLESAWELHPATGVLSRRDVLSNEGAAPVVVTRCLARFAFPPARYEAYVQDSRWSNENQGAWTPVRTGALRLGCLRGRTTEGNTPYLCLREAGGAAVAFHVVPEGNWTISVRVRPCGRRMPWIVVEAGLSDEDLFLRCPPGGRIELPEILVQDVPAGDPRRAAPALHRYVNGRGSVAPRKAPPVVYNTWFDRFDRLEPARLRRHLKAAREIGCEVFAVDAGWFGRDGTGWTDRGDWREKPGTAFRGRMADFAREVRAAGLGFGLWMEPETFVPGVPVRTEHPDWFLPSGRLAIERDDAYAYQRDEISRLVETYGLAWMKVDFNSPLGSDPTGTELGSYYRRWHRLLDDIRRRHPRLHLENCASGAMRLDIGSARRFDSHFISDTVEPIDVLRIAQGLFLRFPPGRVGRWAVLRSVGTGIPGECVEASADPVSVAAPGGATWRLAVRTDPDFAMAVAVPGALGLSGDLAGLPERMRRRIAWYVAFNKRWRRFLSDAAVHLLTPAAPIEDRRGWVAFQFQNADRSVSLVFAYQLGDGSDTGTFRLFDLDPGAAYAVRREGPDGGAVERRSGAGLSEDGLSVRLEGGFHAERRAAVFSVRRAPAGSVSRRRIR